MRKLNRQLWPVHAVDPRPGRRAYRGDHGADGAGDRSRQTHRRPTRRARGSIASAAFRTSRSRSWRGCCRSGSTCCEPRTFTRVCDFHLDGDALRICGASRPEDITRAKKLLEAGVEPGREFCEHWLGLREGLSERQRREGKSPNARHSRPIWRSPCCRRLQAEADKSAVEAENQRGAKVAVP